MAADNIPPAPACCPHSGAPGEDTSPAAVTARLDHLDDLCHRLLADVGSILEFIEANRETVDRARRLAGKFGALSRPVRVDGGRANRG